MSYKLNNDAVCGMIGYGSWATALVHTLLSNGQKIWWHIRNAEVLESIQTEGRNAKYLNDIELDKDLINATEDLNEVVRFILSATKGIISDGYKTITEYFRDTYNLSYDHLGLISGPSHAEEVSRDRLSYLTVATTDEDNGKAIGLKFSTPTVQIRYSQDIYGIEYAGILKNIYALAGGLAVGLGYGDNFRAVLTAAGAQEMTRFIQESYPFERNTMESAYLGDLLVTSYSSFSRNRRLGQMIGHGITVKSALNEMTMIAEGYFAAECIKHINERHNVNMPIADMVYDVLYKRANPRRRMKELSTQL